MKCGSVVTTNDIDSTFWWSIVRSTTIPETGSRVRGAYSTDTGCASNHNWYASGNFTTHGGESGRNRRHYQSDLSIGGPLHVNDEHLAYDDAMVKSQRK